MNERDLIALFQSDAEHLDDCALLSPAAAGTDATGELLITTDVMVEGTHFRRDWSDPQDLAWRLFHCNLSDLCASGVANANGGLLQLGLPAPADEQFARQFGATLRGILSEHGCALVGGDTYRAPVVSLGLVLWGRTRRAIGRSGGVAGDTLYLTGPLGLALAGQQLLEREGRSARGHHPPGSLEQAALDRFLRGQARCDFALRASPDPRVHAALDLSDGLRTDCGRLARASGLEICIDLDRVPLGAPGLLENHQAVDSGEEFEILFLGAAGLEGEYGAAAIGTARLGVAGRLEFLADGVAVELEGHGYEHF